MSRRRSRSPLILSRCGPDRDLQPDCPRIRGPEAGMKAFQMAPPGRVVGGMPDSCIHGNPTLGTKANGGQVSSGSSRGDPRAEVPTAATMYTGFAEGEGLEPPRPFRDGSFQDCCHTIRRTLHSFECTERLRRSQGPAGSCASCRTLTRFASVHRSVRGAWSMVAGGKTSRSVRRRGRTAVSLSRGGTAL